MAEIGEKLDTYFLNSGKNRMEFSLFREQREFKNKNFQSLIDED